MTTLPRSRPCRARSARRRAVALAVLLAAAGLGSCARPVRSVLLVTVDTLRADRLAIAGDPRAVTPALARLAARGTVFEHALSPAAVTGPAHVSIFTGRYPSFHSVGQTNGIFRLDETTPTLATLLGARGFATGAVVSNPVLQRALGLARGFATYDDRFEGVEGVRGQPERYADRAVDLALGWLEARAGAPFFFWLHLQDPHGPYSPRDETGCPPAPADGRTLPAGSDPSGDAAIPDYQMVGDERRVADYVRRYDCEITFTDRQLGRLLERVESDPALAGTLVVFTADHGEALGEDDFWFAHGHSAGLDQVWVPLVLAGPGVPAARREARAVSTAWLAATVLAAAGVEPPPGIEGPSLLAVLDDATLELPPIFVETGPQPAMAWRGAYLRRDRRAAGETEFWRGNGWRPLGTELVAIGAGDVAGPPGTTELERRLSRFERRAAAARRGFEAFHLRIEYNEDQLRTLRSLGYLR